MGDFISVIGDIDHQGVTIDHDECQRILKAAEACQEGQDPLTFIRWDLLIITALSTGMRRGELLNCTWRDMDFERLAVDVSPKEDTAETWEWQIKDADRRTLPLTDDIVSLLIQDQEGQPEGYPYVFVPVVRYDRIQKLRKQGRWKFGDSRLKVINNFTRQFNQILERAACKRGEFHDFRRTALTHWLTDDMSEHEVMVLAGHAGFSTTHRFCLAVADDLVDRAREAVGKVLSQDLLRTCCARPISPTQQKRPATVNDCRPATYSNGQGRI